MRKLIFFTGLLMLIQINVIAQKWVVVKQYKDEFGDLTGKRSIVQIVEGSAMSSPDIKLLVRVSRDVPSTDDFKISLFDTDGKVYEVFKVQIGMVKAQSKTNKPQVTIPVEGKYLFKYKTGETESSFRLLKPNTVAAGKTKSSTINVNYSELNTLLLSTSAPLKCIIAEEIKGGQFSNLIRFTLLPANYSQLVQ